MPTVHPAYDPQARVWFVDEPPVEAPTIPALIQALKTKTPKQWRVQDYFPVGTVVRWRDDRAAVTAADAPVRIDDSGPFAPPRKNWNSRGSKPGTPLAAAPPPPPPPPPPPVVEPTPEKAPKAKRVRGPTERKFTRRNEYKTWDRAKYEKALDMWAQGIRGNVIAQRLGVSRLTVCSHWVANARSHGDPRAVVRSVRCGVKKGEKSTASGT